MYHPPECRSVGSGGFFPTCRMGFFGTGQVLSPCRSTEISQATCGLQPIHSLLNPGFPKEHCNSLGLRKDCSVSQNIRRKRDSDLENGLVDTVEERVQFSSVAQLCLTICDPMGCSKPGLLVHHQLQELTQTHVH